ncbi:kinase-like protein [Corynespora cassiicola Philippines]|uniref:non-specific serine/threonine protein kinase n=1 Tax=Corynespora cassiicola Philippines TaxID=1448308 RepID=A0A2T2NQS2_CORCC|nr:kinase-like protein [Corynespora cassiicola Philippines]
MSINPQEYEVVYDLGRGNGMCNDGILVVRNRHTKTLCVEKKFFLEHVVEGLIDHEAYIQSGLDHPNIVELFEYKVNLCGGSIFLEYCDLGTLHDLILGHANEVERIGEYFIWKIFTQLADAVTYCHYGPDPKNDRNWRMILHRDIKPANILLKWVIGEGMPTVKLTDFGVSLECGPHRSWFPSPMSPEVHNVDYMFRPPEYPIISEFHDVWQLGATIYHLCSLGVGGLIEQFPEQAYSNQLFRATYTCCLNDPNDRPPTQYGALVEYLCNIYMQVCDGLEQEFVLFLPVTSLD